ncbi:RIP metalloprotease RseP [Paracoccus shanxieyensis]|uniref:Zinc metalloprotease n=1 Tax=Paracoccus shanxieyensis TaxID=2675752 RepID=A0A6L6IYV2_9RHOB|nr:RIP metalloprotease RseP [Paracoccus shanxieyensis]MTH64748.1 RIP metalloprotease RseP [Paracoccus shanxieyensis]MTH88019.1 RIP metalloprotease RseP [Paracoccus shanxieyensis]
MAMLAELGGLLWTICAFVLALSIIVTVHEYGHYIIGRLSGIKAEVFSLGFGPRLLSWRDKRGTVWQLAAIPLGGYVRFLGDANAASAGSGATVDPAQSRASLPGAPLWARIATVAAGPVFNFILSILVFGGMAMWQGLPADTPAVGKLHPTPPGIAMGLQAGDKIVALDGKPVASWADLGQIAADLPARAAHDWTVQRDGAQMVVQGPDPMPALITGVAPRSPAASAGLRGGDVILAIDGAPVSRFDELRTRVVAAEGNPVLLRVWREGAGEADYTLAAREQDLPTADGYEKRWMIGVTGGGTYFDPATRPVGPAEALGLGAARTWDIIASSVSGLWAMVSGQIGTCNLGGAISIAESTGQAASAGGMDFIWWIAVLSAAIGFLNLLPVPVLDGGHLMFYAYEAVAGRRPSDRVLDILSALGMAAVLSLMIFGLTNDLFCP